MEIGSEAGDGIKQCFRIGANPQQDRRKIGIDGSPFIQPYHASRLVHRIECSAVIQDPPSLGI